MVNKKDQLKDSQNRIEKIFCKRRHNTSLVGKTNSGACKKCLKMSDKQYYLKHKEQIRVRVKLYYQNNKDIRNNYEKQRLHTDINYKLARYLRSRLNSAVKNNQKSGSAVKDLGCSVIELKQRLEKQFKPGMSWNNRGNGDNKWNIDHIADLQYFDLSKDNEFKMAVHHTNLQPLWFKDNINKSNQKKGVKIWQ